MKLSFVKDVQLPDDGIFLSSFADGLSFFRKAHLEVCLKRGHLDENFDLVSDTWERPDWEDPRVFCRNGKRYYANNYNWKSKEICEVETGAIHTVRLSGGKNYTYLPSDNSLLAVYSLSPLEIYDVTTETPVKLQMKSCLEADLLKQDPSSWRGGTAGVMLEPGVFAGFGHQTVRNPVCKHFPFFWKIRMQDDRCEIDAQLVELEGADTLCDPTCVFERGGKWYLLTAQSRYEWHGQFPTILKTSLYEFTW